MTPDDGGARRREAALLVVLAALPALTLVLIPAIPVGPAEWTHWAEVVAMGGDGRLVIRNGGGLAPDPALRPGGLAAGRDGTVSTLSPGWSLIGSGLAAILGPMAIQALNALAAAITVILTHRLARAVTPDRAAALMAPAVLCLATFFPLAAWGLLPAAGGAACVAFALWRGLRATGRRDAAAAGLAAGAATLFTPAAPVLLPLAVLLPRPLAIAALTGALPGLAAAAAVHLARWGAVSPSPDTLTALALGWGAVATALPARGIHRAALAAATLAALALLPGTTDTLRTLWALLADIRLSPVARGGVAMPSGTVYFDGHARKALGQSLPWCLLVLILIRPGSGPLRLVLPLVAGWALFLARRAVPDADGPILFAMVPLLPLLSVAVAVIAVEAARTLATARPLATGLLTGLLAYATWLLLGADRMAGPGQILSLLALALLAALALGARLMPSLPRARIALTGTGAGLALSAMALAQDAGADAALRAAAARSSARIAMEPGRVLVAGRPAAMGHAPGRADRALAATADPALIRRALDTGWRVLVAAEDAPRLLTAWGLVAGRRIALPSGDVVEILRPAAPPSATSRGATRASLVRP